MKNYIPTLLARVKHEPLVIEHEQRTRTQQLRDSYNGQRVWLLAERSRLEKQIAADTALLAETNECLASLETAINRLERTDEIVARSL